MTWVNLTTIFSYLIYIAVFFSSLWSPLINTASSGKSLRRWTYVFFPRVERLHFEKESRQISLSAYFLSHARGEEQRPSTEDISKEIYRGEYMGTRKYGISFWVINLISQSFAAALTREEIKLDTRREISYLQATAYYINILMTALVLTTFQRFSNTFQRFPKILQKLSEGLMIVPNIFR